MADATLHHRRQRAFTILEMLVAMVASAFLLAGLGSVLFIARQTAYSPTAASRRSRTADIANLISDELRYATIITQQTPQILEFIVADRNNDGVSEKIHYEWSGTPGDSLRKSINGGALVDVLTSVYAFSVTQQQSPRDHCSNHHRRFGRGNPTEQHLTLQSTGSRHFGHVVLSPANRSDYISFRSDQRALLERHKGGLLRQAGKRRKWAIIERSNSTHGRPGKWPDEQCAGPAQHSKREPHNERQLEHGRLCFPNTQSFVDPPICCRLDRDRRQLRGSESAITPPAMCSNRKIRMLRGNSSTRTNVLQVIWNVHYAWHIVQRYAQLRFLRAPRLASREPELRANRCQYTNAQFARIVSRLLADRLRSQSGRYGYERRWHGRLGCHRRRRLRHQQSRQRNLDLDRCD